MMKNILLSACAAVVIATGASAASAGDIVVRHDNLSGTIIRVDDFRPGYGWHDNGYNNGNGYGNYDNGYNYGDYRQHGVVSPRWIVRNLQRADYRYISRPVLTGRYYQVKAVHPNGHKVKLYIDAYSGRIVKIKG
jgi:opacity protein-like surface antigen